MEIFSKASLLPAIFVPISRLRTIGTADEFDELRAIVPVIAFQDEGNVTESNAGIIRLVDAVIPPERMRSRIELAQMVALLWRERLFRSLANSLTGGLTRSTLELCGMAERPPASVDDVARVLGYSREHLSRSIRREC